MGEGPLLCTSLVDMDLTGRWCEKGVDCISLMTHTHGRRGAILVTALLHWSWVGEETPLSYCNCCIRESSQALCSGCSHGSLGRVGGHLLHSSLQLLCVKRQRCLETRWLLHPVSAKEVPSPLSPRRHHLPFSAQQRALVWRGAGWCQTSPAPPWLHATAE